MAHLTLYNKNNFPDQNDINCSKSEDVPPFSIDDVQLRFLVPDDMTEIRLLCQDWFPIDYSWSWYEIITSSSTSFALGAVYNLAIIGLIVAEIKPYRMLNEKNKGILPDSIGRSAVVGYILSLGVHRKYRRKGIGSLLLDSLVNHLTILEHHSVKAIYLHVLATNQPAISFYEKRRFHRHSFLPCYYNIQGNRKDGLIYVAYLNGGYQPCSLLDHNKHIVSKISFVVGVLTWALECLRQLLRWICQETVPGLMNSPNK